MARCCVDVRLRAVSASRRVASRAALRASPSRGERQLRCVVFLAVPCRAAVKTRKEIIADSARRIFQHIKPPADPHPKRTGISCIGRLRGDQLLLCVAGLLCDRARLWGREIEMCRFRDCAAQRRLRLTARVAPFPHAQPVSISHATKVRRALHRAAGAHHGSRQARNRCAKEGRGQAAKSQGERGGPEDVAHRRK